MKTWNDWWKETKPAECDEYKEYFCECWHVSQSEQYKKDKEKIDDLLSALEEILPRFDAFRESTGLEVSHASIRARSAIAKAKGVQNEC